MKHGRFDAQKKNNRTPHPARHHRIVLMYHGIIAEEADRPSRPEAGAALYDVALADFEKQMAFLAEHGVTVTTDLSEKPTPSGKQRQVVLTFDDGERNNLTRGLPVLQRYGFRAFFFITTTRLGEGGYLNEDDVRALTKTGMLIGSHGYDHDLLIGKKPHILFEELVMSRRRLSEIIGCEVDCFSVPRGFYDDDVLDIIAKAGFRQVFVSSPCPLKRPHKGVRLHPRSAVKRHWSLSRFAQAVEGHTPMKERLLASGRRVCLGLFGARGYDALRRILLGGS